MKVQNKEMYEIMKNRKGFIAALDQSGGSTPKTLTNYGISRESYDSDERMFELVHEMRRRIVTSSSFTSEHILGAILFEKTMKTNIEEMPTAEYLWKKKQIIPFLKIDKGLQEMENGVKLMKLIPNLCETLIDARNRNIFGTKMRSVIYEPNQEGIRKCVEQQFEFAKLICENGLVPIMEPEVDINAPQKEKCEEILKTEIIRCLKHWRNENIIMFKLTLPSEPNFYLDLYDYQAVLKVVALSGGYDTDTSVRLLAENNKVIASFSRALLQDLRVNQTQDEFDKTLKDAIIKTYNASIT